MLNKILGLVLIVICFNASFTAALRSGYTANNAIMQSAWLHSQAAYCSEAQINGWADSCPPARDIDNFELAQVITSSRLATQAYVGSYLESGHIIIAFRGTHNQGDATFRNWFSNANFPTRSFDGVRGADVHGSYYNALRRVRGRIRARVEELLREVPEARIMCTGHSMGGALAQMMCTELIVRPVAQSIEDRMSIITFGAPRCGDRTFSTQSNRAEIFWRVVVGGDGVPRVPLAPNPFMHGGEEVYFRNRRTTSSRNCGTVDGSIRCSYGNWRLSVTDHSRFQNQRSGTDGSITFPNNANLDLFWDELIQIPNTPNRSVRPTAGTGLVGARISQLGRFVGGWARTQGARVANVARDAWNRESARLRDVANRARDRARRTANRARDRARRTARRAGRTARRTARRAGRRARRTWRRARRRLGF